MLLSPSIEAHRVKVRPATRLDQERIQALVRGLTPRTRYLRFFNGVQELAQRWLERFSNADARSEYSVLAIAEPTGIAVGMAQYCTDPYPERADFAVVVADRWQGLGIGTRLVCRLLDVARANGVKRIEADVLSENRRAIELVKRLGFEVRRERASGLLLRASLALAGMQPHYSCNSAAVL